MGLLALGLLVMGQMVWAGEPKNLLKNAGFEKIEPYTVPQRWKGKLEATERPKKWGVVNVGGSYGKLTVIYDAITSHGGSKYIRLESDSMAFWGGGIRPPVNPDKKYLIKIWAKGKGAINIGAYGYSTPGPRGGKFVSSTGSGWMEVKNADKWKEYKFELSTKSKPDIKSIMIVFTIKGIVYLDDAYFAPLPEEGK